MKYATDPMFSKRNIKALLVSSALHRFGLFLHHDTIAVARKGDMKDRWFQKLLESQGNGKLGKITIMIWPTNIFLKVLLHRRCRIHIPCSWISTHLTQLKYQNRWIDIRRLIFVFIKMYLKYILKYEPYNFHATIPISYNYCIE